jgi:hypothetical protein
VNIVNACGYVYDNLISVEREGVVYVAQSGFGYTCLGLVNGVCVSVSVILVCRLPVWVFLFLVYVVLAGRICFVAMC